MTIDPRDPVALARALIRCPSVTPAEGGALALLERVLAPLGFSCHRLLMKDESTYDVENLYARRGGARPHLCFAGHTDVVPPGDLEAWKFPPFAAEIHEGALYGRGAADMKGAIACFVAAVARVLAERGGGIPGSLSLLITGDEEGLSLNGTAKILDWLKAQDEVLDACVVGEPTNPSVLGEEIKIGRRGSLNADLSVAGVQGHAAYPERASNPIPKLAHIVSRLSALRLDEGSRFFEPSNLAVTILSVPNTAVNVIPGRASAAFNVRYNDLWTREAVEAWVRARCREAAEEVDAEISLSFSGTGSVFLTEPGPLSALMSEAVEAVTGRQPRLTTGGGTSDARFIKDVCPVIEFGLPGASIHKANERAALADLEGLTEIYRLFIERFFAHDDPLSSALRPSSP